MKVNNIYVPNNIFLIDNYEDMKELSKFENKIVFKHELGNIDFDKNRLIYTLKYFYHNCKIDKISYNNTPINIFDNNGKEIFYKEKYIDIIGSKINNNINIIEYDINYKHWVVRSHNIITSFDFKSWFNGFVPKNVFELLEIYNFVKYVNTKDRNFLKIGSLYYEKDDYFEAVISSFQEHLIIEKSNCKILLNLLEKLFNFTSMYN